MSSSRKRDRSTMESEDGALATFSSPSANVGWKAQAKAAKQKLEETFKATSEKEEQLQRIQEAMQRSKEKLQLLCDTNQFVSLNIGSTVFDVPVSTLLSEEGSIFETLLSQHYMLDVDAQGAIMIDRDPASFRHIINYLRGYRRFNLTPEELALVEMDIDYYMIPKMRQAIYQSNGENVPNSSNANRFVPGAGINQDGSRLRVAYAVSLIGDQMLIAGRHTIHFEVLSGEYLGMGVVSENCVSTDVEFHKTPNCCVFYMTGVFYSNFPNQRKEEGLDKFTTGDIVSCTLDMDEKTIQYAVRGVTTKVISCAPATRLRFAAVGKLSSGCRIIPSDSPLLLKQRKESEERSVLSTMGATA